MPPYRGATSAAAPRYILACLQAEGFTTTCTPGWTDSRYLAAVATRGVEIAPVQPAGFDPRIAAVDLTTRADKLSDHAALLTTIGLRPDRAAANGHRPW